ncbi:hypothetical protein FRC18_002458 [Serendipita sp. 400]|nr:hypothetical protein FRC18_002458 [Serendipita sp. 400]
MADIAEFEKIVRKEVKRRVSKDEQAPSWSDIKRLIKEKGLFNDDRIQDPAFKARLKDTATKIATQIIEGDREDEELVLGPKGRHVQSPKGKRKTQDDSEEERPKKRVKKAPKVSKESEKRSEEDPDPRPTKRAKQPPTKGVKPMAAKGKSHVVQESDEEDVPVKARPIKKVHRREESSVAGSEVDTTGKPPNSPELPDSSPKEPKSRLTAADVAQLSDSDLSVLEDDSPVKARKPKENRRPSVSKEKSKQTKKGGKGKGKAETDANVDINEDQIKKLKALVAACGVRKKWAKEFEGMEDKPKQQLSRLKEILAELGMTGRMSLEKAKSIRAKRELAAELEDVVQFEARRGLQKDSKQTKSREKRSGKVPIDVPGDDDDDNDDGDDESEVDRTNPPARRKNILAFLDDQSEEE